MDGSIKEVFVKNLAILLVIAFLLAVVVSDQREIQRLRRVIKAWQAVTTLDSMSRPIDNMIGKIKE